MQTYIKIVTFLPFLLEKFLIIVIIDHVYAFLLSCNIHLLYIWAFLSMRCRHVLRAGLLVHAGVMSVPCLQLVSMPFYGVV